MNFRFSGELTELIFTVKITAKQNQKGCSILINDHLPRYAQLKTVEAQQKPKRLFFRRAASHANTVT